MLKIGIVDDHQLFRISLAMLINSFKGLKVVVEAENGKDLLEKLLSRKVDILLLDLDMPKMDGFETCKIIRNRYPAIKVLIVSQLTSQDSIHKIFELDAHGYFTKNSNPKDLQEAINGLSENGYYFEDTLATVIREVLSLKAPEIAAASKSNVVLSAREVQIIRMACKEYNSIEIGDRLHISVSTVETHRKRIMEKTNSKNFIGVVLFALRNNYLQLDEI